MLSFLFFDRKALNPTNKRTYAIKRSKWKIIREEECMLHGLKSTTFINIFSIEDNKRVDIGGVL